MKRVKMAGNIFITSDTHFGHKMLVDTNKRPFSTVEGMDSTLVAKWEKWITDEDRVFHLGDVCVGCTQVEPEKLSGDITFIKGNHDKKSLTDIDSVMMTFQGHKVEMVHKPQNATFTRPIVLHGHIHKNGSRRLPFHGEYVAPHIFVTTNGTVFFNVNVEFHNWRPKLLNEIIGEIKLWTGK